MVARFLIGEVVRDWAIASTYKVLFPYDDAVDLRVRDDWSDEAAAALRYLWPWKSVLAHRATFQGRMEDSGLRWYEYMQYTASANRTPLSIAFAFVATHNHFVLDRGGKVFNRSAPSSSSPPPPPRTTTSPSSPTSTAPSPLSSSGRRGTVRARKALTRGTNRRSGSSSSNTAEPSSAVYRCRIRFEELAPLGRVAVDLAAELAACHPLVVATQAGLSTSLRA